MFTRLLVTVHFLFHFRENTRKIVGIDGVWIINEFIVDSSEIEIEVEIQILHVTKGYEFHLQANYIAKVVRNVKLSFSSFFRVCLLGSFLAS